MDIQELCINLYEFIYIVWISHILVLSIFYKYTYAYSRDILL
jgi:hypothetical protein